MPPSNSDFRCRVVINVAGYRHFQENDRRLQSIRAPSCFRGLNFPRHVAPLSNENGRLHNTAAAERALQQGGECNMSACWSLEISILSDQRQCRSRATTITSINLESITISSVAKSQCFVPQWRHLMPHHLLSIRPFPAQHRDLTLIGPSPHPRSPIRRCLLPSNGLQLTRINASRFLETSRGRKPAPLSAPDNNNPLI